MSYPGACPVDFGMPFRFACVIEDIGENKRRQGMASTVEDTDLFLACSVSADMD